MIIFRQIKLVCAAHNHTLVTALHVGEDFLRLLPTNGFSYGGFYTVKFVLWFLCYFSLGFLVVPEYGVFDAGLVPFLCLCISISWLSYLSASLIRNYIAVTYWVFIYLFIILAAISQQTSLGFPWMDHYEKEVILNTWLMLLMSILATSIGFIVFRADTFVAQPYLVDSKKLSYLLLFSIAVTFLCIMILGGVGVLFLAREEIFKSLEGATSKNLIIIAGLRVPLYITSLIYLDRLLCDLKSGGANKITATGVVLLLLATLIINNPISTPRFWFGCVVLSYCFVFLMRINLKTSLNWLVSSVLIFSIIIVFPLADIFRRSTDVDIINSIRNTNFGSIIFVSPNFDAFQQIMNTMVVVEMEGFRYGIQLLSALFFWVPRSIWSAKSFGSGQVVAEELNYNYTNLSSPIWAEFYLDFGLVGVVVVSLAIGVFLKFASQLGAKNYAVMLAFFSAYQTYFLRGSLISTLAFLFLALACLYYVRKKG